MTYQFTPHGVCSQLMEIELEGDTVRHLNVVGGCNGNLQAISRLVEGMTVEEAVAKLRGIRCGTKPTSCPDQLTYGLEKALQAEEKASLRAMAK